MNRTAKTTFHCISFLLLSTTAQADYVWTGAGDGVSVYQEANWMDTVTGEAPPAGSINRNVPVASDLIVYEGSPGGSGGAGPYLVLGSHSLSIMGGVFRLGANVGIMQGEAHVMGGELITQFFADGFEGGVTHGTQVTLGGDGRITLNGEANPLPHGAAINIISTAATLQFNNETPAEFINEHLTKITVFGAAAEIGNQFDTLETGDNLMIKRLGTSGSIITAVPEPNTLMLFSFLPLLVFGRRSRRLADTRSESAELNRPRCAI